MYHWLEMMGEAERRTAFVNNGPFVIVSLLQTNVSPTNIQAANNDLSDKTYNDLLSLFSNGSFKSICLRSGYLQLTANSEKR